MDDNDFFLLVFFLDRGGKDGVPLELSPGISHACMGVWRLERFTSPSTKYRQVPLMRSSSSPVQVQLRLMRSSSSTAYPYMYFALAAWNL